ncbi:MAG TPA: PAS domain S-box protein [Chitinophagaceae bacterium]|nr:PAS domain S-box protein [Chitinophagaceae bacterium]
MEKAGINIPLPLFLKNSAKFPAFITNFQGEITDVNELFFELSGTGTYEQHILVSDVFTDNSFDAFFYNWSKILEGTPLTLYSSVNNCEVCWEVSVYGNNNFICTGTIIRATGKTNMVSTNPYTVFFDNSPALMWATDKDGRLRMMNKRYREHTGFTDKHIGCLVWDIYPKEMADQFKRNDDIVFASNKPIEIEEVSINKAGIKRNYLAYKFPLVTGQHGAMVAGCSIDITDILEKNQQLYFQSHLLESIEQAVYVLNTARQVIYWNSCAEKMFGWPKKDIFLQDIAVLVPGVAILQKIDYGESWDGEADLKHKDGSLIQVHLTKSPVFDNHNNVAGFIGIAKDISETKIVHKKLVKQNNQFRQIARLQSHAVRRPLANILGLIDLIQYYSDKNEPKEVLYMINLLKQSSEDLDDIIRRIVLKAGVYFDPALRIA